MNTFGFIIIRHVNSENTNKYWNHSVKLLRTYYPNKKIVIIDDNSNKNLVKPDFEYKNVEVIQSEFHGRGELLPYYYYIKNKFFDNAVIIHDSVFFHTRVNFELLNGINVIPLWFFIKDKDNIDNTLRISNYLNNNHNINNNLNNAYAETTEKNETNNTETLGTNINNLPEPQSTTLNETIGTNINDIN
jgi:hypothetical protein